MENSLDSVLSEESSEVEEVTQQAAETQSQVTDTDQEDTGDNTGAPPETLKDDPLEKHRKGLEAAATAERRKRQEAEARAEAAERRARELEQQHQQRQTQHQQGTDQEPQRDQFATDVEYIRALARHEAKQLREAEKVQEKAEREQREAEEKATARAVKSQSIVAQAQALGGFDMKAFADVPITEKMLDAILESDIGGKLVHHLAANPEEATRISALSETRQIAELARIEDKLNAAPPPEEKDKPLLPKTLTQARDTRGRFDKPETYDGPTPLNAILASK